jgi:hypothetical protein
MEAITRKISIMNKISFTLRSYLKNKESGECSAKPGMVSGQVRLVIQFFDIPAKKKKKKKKNETA